MRSYPCAWALVSNGRASPWGGRGSGGRVVPALVSARSCSSTRRRLGGGGGAARRADPSPTPIGFTRARGAGRGAGPDRSSATYPLDLRDAPPLGPRVQPRLARLRGLGSSCSPSRREARLAGEDHHLDGRRRGLDLRRSPPGSQLHSCRSSTRDLQHAGWEAVERATRSRAPDGWAARLPVSTDRRFARPLRGDRASFGGPASGEDPARAAARCAGLRGVRDGRARPV